ncbi:LOW QUALITY PROTEIN: hypothetical protein Cgig2_010408 [Carnegiea gigantea]|uniref:Uncharacterized protein n=1 Tax=Carnegiea gigantea TaxID=171969 RepID=A0A9Q1JRH6_9CARY|nr:LOW QUALITY PROTEIN: hypothetical protein Cgig2_010408 [Carnegiea gigantea]
MSSGPDSKEECQLEGELMGSSSITKKTIWKWILKVKNIPNQDFLFYYKQALLSNPNGNGLEGQTSANEAVEEDVHEDLSNNSETISQSLDNAHSCPIYIGKLPSQAPSRGSLMEDAKKLIAPCTFLVMLLKWNFNFMKKVKDINFPARKGNKNSKLAQTLPMPTEITKEILNFGKRLGISVISGETLAIRRIRRNLRKELDNKRQARDLIS